MVWSRRRVGCFESLTRGKEDESREGKSKRGGRVGYSCTPPPLSFFHQSPGDPSKRLVRTEFVRLVPFVHGLDLPTLADDRPLFGSLESLTRHPRNNPGHPRLILVYPVHEEQRPLSRRPPEKPKDDEACRVVLADQRLYRLQRRL